MTERESQYFFKEMDYHPSIWNLAGMPPQAMRARCSTFRYCPDPLGIVSAEQLNKLEFGGDAPAGNSCLVQCVSVLPLARSVSFLRSS